MYIWLSILIVSVLVNGNVGSRITLPATKAKSHVGPKANLEPDISDDNTDFQMLITGGYRPIRHTLTKYVVSIRTSRPTEYFDDNHFCAGVIVASTLILTAAHCIMDLNKVITRPRRLSVVAGAPNRLRRDKSTVEYDVVDVIPHDGYIPKGKHDIALLRLGQEISPDNDNIKILPMTLRRKWIGSNCTTLGWGQLFLNGPFAAEAVYINLIITKNSVCTKKFPNLDDRGIICAQDKRDQAKDVCRGDTGGPLICSKTLVGIVSWGAQCTAGYPSVFTNVRLYRQWINAHNDAPILRPAFVIWLLTQIIGMCCWHFYLDYDVGILFDYNVVRNSTIFNT